MKCPKCGYLGFEDVERCRNCGYDFSLTSAAPLPDLTLRRDTPAMAPLDDLTLIDAALPTARPRLTDAAPDYDRLIGEPEPAPTRARPAPARHKPADFDELPLFGSDLPDDEPLITKASAPRPPLAVRRATPEIPRLRSEAPRAPSSELPIDAEAGEPHQAAPRAPTRIWSGPSSAATRSGAKAGEESRDAGIGARLAAVLVDLLILAVIDVMVVYFTMQICGITLDDAGILPKGPLLAFLVVQNGGYLVAFTAGGQTLGKMAAGIRIVAADHDTALDLSRAFLRTVMWVMLAVPAGLGFVTAIISRDHRGLHDRFAGTRVVSL